MQDRVRAWQDYINSFEYDFTGRQRVERRRDGGVAAICRGALDIARTALPIQCVDAVFLAIQLTTGADEVSHSL
jgi:hypothetical protein